MELVDAAADNAAHGSGGGNSGDSSQPGAASVDGSVAKAGGGRPSEAVIATQVEHLRVLRHLVRAIQLDARTPAASGWNWGKLLRAIDFSLQDYETACTQSSNDTAVAAASSARPTSLASPLVSRAMQGESSGSVEPAGADLARSPSGNNKAVLDGLKQKQGEEWARLARVAWKRCTIAVGHTVDVQRRRHKRLVAGKVLRVCHGHMAMIHYTGWSDLFDEIYPVDEMELLHTGGDGGGDGDGDDGGSKLVKAGTAPRVIRSNDHVTVPWGTQGDKCTAIVLWTTPKVDGAQVQFSHDAKEDEGYSLQWITGLDVVPKQRTCSRTCREK